MTRRLAGPENLAFPRGFGGGARGKSARPRRRLLSGQALVHLVGNGGPEAQLGKVVVAQGVDRQKTDNRERFDTMARAKTNDMRTDARNIDHEGFPKAGFYFMDYFLHDRGNRARKMRLRGDMIWVKKEARR